MIIYLIISPRCSAQTLKSIKSVID